MILKFENKDRNRVNCDFVTNYYCLGGFTIVFEFAQSAGAYCEVVVDDIDSALKQIDEAFEENQKAVVFIK